MQILHYIDPTCTSISVPSLYYSETDQWLDNLSTTLTELSYNYALTYSCDLGLATALGYDTLAEGIQLYSAYTNLYNYALVIDVDLDSSTWSFATSFDNSLSATQIVYLPYNFNCTFQIKSSITFNFYYFFNGYIGMKSPELTAYTFDFGVAPTTNVTSATYLGNVGTHIVDIVSNEDHSNGTLVYSQPITLSSDFGVTNVYYSDSSSQMVTYSNEYFASNPIGLYLYANTYSGTSYSSIWQTGYDYGYDVGYDEGYDVGSDDTGGLNNFFSVLSGAFESVGSILNTEIFYGMTIGTLIFIPLCFAVIMFIIDKIKS